MSTSLSLEAALLRGVLSTTAHDLGGLASALSLRADVLERGASAEGGTALRRIANELRTLGQDVRAFRSAEGGDSLSPTRPGSLEQWLARTLRYGKPMLPRGSTLEGRAPEATVESEAALDLMYIAFAVFQQIASDYAEQRVAVQLHAEADETHATITISANAEEEPLLLQPDAESAEWWHWALERANKAEITMRTDEGRVSLTAPLVKRA